MKEITVSNKVRTLVDVESDFSDAIIPAGTLGVVIECYENPISYAVDLSIPDNNLVGGFRYENVVLMPDQLVAI
jgi:hypothetical protein